MTATETLEFQRIQNRATAAEASAQDLRAQLAAETNAHAATKKKLADVEAKSSTADRRAMEQLAAKGIPPAPKDSPAALETLAEGETALIERYLAASYTEKTRMLEQYGDKLTRSAEAYDRARAGR
jgi:hypothetical protein